MKAIKWKVLGKLQNSKTPSNKKEEIVNILLENRGIKKRQEREEFLNPIHPRDLTLEELKVDKTQVEKTIRRIKAAIVNKEKIIVYGDYDADGVSGIAIVWEALWGLKADVLPYIPERFSEGYGLNAESVKNLKSKYKNLKLIITVDNGIVARDAVKKAKDIGINVIITDHHEKGEKYPEDAFAVIHTMEIGGAGIAWILSREINKDFALGQLDLAAMGTIADQLPLIGPNRSFAKYGILALRETKRPGLREIYNLASIDPKTIDTYHVNFMIAPRVNAMGRLAYAIESIRLLCTKSPTKALELSTLLEKTNRDRQNLVEETVVHAKEKALKTNEKIIILHSDNYHEGIIGLAASRLVEEFYRPSIVLSIKGDIAKASARSVSGFNIIKAIRLVNEYLIDGGGHEMAAGFSIETKNIEIFAKQLIRKSRTLLTESLLQKRLKIDVELELSDVSFDLIDKIKQLEPFGIGNPAPVFMTSNVQVTDARLVGREGKHLKIKVVKGNIALDAIAFGRGDMYSQLGKGSEIDIAYSIEENEWNGTKSIQLKVRDIRFLKRDK